MEASSGSLGQGLGAAVGNALAARSRGSAYRVYVIMGDGEQQEGSIGDGCRSLQARQPLRRRGRERSANRWLGQEVMNVQPLSEKYAAFGWNVIEIDGNDMRQILDAFARARETSGRPTVILARTVKGKALPELLTPDFPRSRVGRRCPSVSTRENCRCLRTKFAPSVTIDLSSFAPPYRVGQSDPQLYVCVPG